jgi:hypothetical protein
MDGSEVLLEQERPVNTLRKGDDHHGTNDMCYLCMEG